MTQRGELVTKRCPDPGLATGELDGCCDTMKPFITSHKE